MFFNRDFTRYEVFRTFSNYLKSVATIPQFWFVFKAKKIDDLATVYLFYLFLSKCFLIPHSIWHDDIDTDFIFQDIVPFSLIISLTIIIVVYIFTKTDYLKNKCIELQV